MKKLREYNIVVKINSTTAGFGKFLIYRKVKIIL